MAALRKSLKQSSTLSTDKENLQKENQRLADQVKQLGNQLRNKEEVNKMLVAREKKSKWLNFLQEFNAGLRHRATLPSSSSSTPAQTRNMASSQQMFIQIQTRVLLFIVLFFTVIGFMLGRFSR